ncbi:MAG: radical SAM family heme chaperone HemW [Magnetococcus sp. YQC-9]
MERAATPLALYVHLPFCLRKCPYCDFFSLPDRLDEEATYVARLIEEIEFRRCQFDSDPRSLQSIFFGGGTPSLLHPSSIETILQAVRIAWQLAPGCEITLEANPESCHGEKPLAWRKAGINRVSLGVQALDDGRLRLLGRPHDRSQALNARAALREAGFENLNADLIYATPEQSLDQWRTELTEAIGWGVPHLSCYALTLEEGTPFTRLHDAGRLRMPQEALSRQFFDFTRSYLADHGYDPYEISNFAKPGWFCRHNRNYWEYGDYLGIGAGAHGKWRDAAGQSWHWANPPDLLHYRSTPFAAPEPLSAREAALESLLMGLRLKEGLSRARYRDLAGVDLLDERAEAVTRLMAAGFLAVNAERVCVTAAGVACLDAVVEQLT